MLIVALGCSCTTKMWHFHFKGKNLQISVANSSGSRGIWLVGGFVGLGFFSDCQTHNKM